MVRRGEVDLAHAGLLYKGQSSDHVGLGSYVRGLFGVEAEGADFVAFAGEVVVD